jgi:large subunit ribosomal protein L29
MPLPKIEDTRKLDDQELADAILAAKRELFDLRMQKATRRLEKPHQFKHVRHRVAQMLTVVREREIAAAAQKTDAEQE